MTRISFAAALLAATTSLAQGAPGNEPATPELKGEATAPEAPPPPRLGLERIHLEGYAKLGYFWTGPAPGDALIGSHNGFRLANVRFGLALALTEKLEVVASIDGSVAKRRETDPLEGSRVVDLKDGYISWSLHRLARLRAGQFKAPYNAETLLGDGALPFISRSVISDGIVPPEGFTRPGLTLDRQIGVEVSSDRLGSERAGVRYAVAAVNGNGANVLNNDNNSVAPVARVTFEMGDMFTFGLNGYFNQESEGIRPFRLTSNRIGSGADVSASVAGVNALAVALFRQTTHPGTALPAENALGLMGSVAYLHQRTGLEGGVRFAFYEPSSVEPDDNLTELSLMLGFRCRKAPIRFLVQYTLRGEEPAVAIGYNNSIDAMAQVSW
ncbi:MAG: hypothetical protein HYZ28_13430 [Myxococcales bacterium]|nr:hypothetical protein [Myxococcales bacterium]